MHPDAERIHGISTAFLRDKPLFSQGRAANSWSSSATRRLVIHNAGFDIGFINMELERLKLRPIGMERVVDTLALARRKHPAGPNTLDALCKRYGIDNTKRIKHGAIVDSLLLAEVYVELLGERQATLGLARDGGSAAARRDAGIGRRSARQRPSPLPPRISDAEIAAHQAFVETLGDGAIWRRYLTRSRRRSADLAVAVHGFGLTALLALDVERGEIDRVEHQRREAAFARQIGDQAAHEREQQSSAH